MKPIEVKEYFNDIIADMSTLVSYPSIYAEDEGTPFGLENQKCLHAALKMAEDYGFKAVNVDDYCGYIEMGQGEEIIGILAHLDVVPVSENGWKTDPFKVTFADGKYYGRGTSDDKGAAVCALTAMRMLKQLEPTFTKRVRLILGCNEESGSRGVAHYVEKYGYVDCGFTPDGNFPLVYGEKGMVGAVLSGKSEKIADIKGGTVFNAVADHCVVTLNEAVDSTKLAEFYEANKVKYNYDGKTLEVFGVASHSSLPDDGVNAISFAMEGLYVAGIQDSLVDAYHKLVGISVHGENAGIDFVDEFSNLSFNIGLAFKQEEELCFTIDIRFPVTLHPSDVMDPLAKAGEGYITVKNGVEPLFFSPEHPMIKALMKAYVDVSGDDKTKPWVIGGGTYAKEMKGIVAFGCDDNKDNYRIHQDDEFVTEDSLLMQTAAYYEAILNLMKI